MRRERNPLRTVALAWDVSAQLARRDPYRIQALPMLRHSAAFMDAAPEFV